MPLITTHAITWSWTSHTNIKRQQEHVEMHSVWSHYCIIKHVTPVHSVTECGNWKHVCCDMWCVGCVLGIRNCCIRNGDIWLRNNALLVIQLSSCIENYTIWCTHLNAQKQVIQAPNTNHNSREPESAQGGDSFSQILCSREFMKSWKGEGVRSSKLGGWGIQWIHNGSFGGPWGDTELFWR